MSRDRPGDRMIAALGTPGLTPIEKIVLAVICWHDGPGGAWPSYQRIADMAGIKRDAAGRAIKSLREKGRLIRQRGRTTNRFIPVIDCRKIPDSEAQYRENSDSDAVSVSEKFRFDCRSFSDTNRNKPESVNHSVLSDSRC